MGTLNRGRVRKLLEEQGKTPRALSLAMGDNPYVVRDILNEKSKNPRSDTLSKMAEALGVSLGEILLPNALADDGPAFVGATPDPRIVPRFLPVCHRVQAGLWYEVDGFAQDYPAPPQAVLPDPRFAEWPQWLEEVVGDSVNLRIAPGGFAHVVDAVAMGYAPRNGDYVVVERRRAGGHLRERTIKQLEVTETGVKLWPRSTNAKWSEPITLTDGCADEDVEVEIVGLVIGAYSPFV